MKRSGGANAYPLVELTESDFDAWARQWCERKGWTFIELVSQTQVNEHQAQLSIRCSMKESVAP